MNRSFILLLSLASCTIEVRPEALAESSYREALHATNPRRALENMDRAIGHHPSAEYYEFRARLNLSLKQYSAALGDMNAAIGLQRNDPTLYFSRAGLLVRANRLKEAEDDLSEAIRLAPDHAEALMHRARLRSGAEAARDIAEARRVGAGLADGFYNDGVRALMQGETAEGERLFGFALDLDPDHSRAHVAMARLHMERRQFAEAAARFDLAIPKYPEDPDLYYHRGNARLASGRGEEAFADYERAVALSPLQASYHAARGLAWHRVKGDPRRAQADFDEAIRLDRKCHPAWINRGILLHELKDLEAAERDLLQAGAIRASPEGCVALGRVFHDRGAYDKALSLYRQALEIYKDPEMQKALRDEVERTRLAKEKK